MTGGRNRRHCANAGASVWTLKRAPPTRATTPKTGGRPTEEPAGTNPKNWTGATLRCNPDDALKFLHVGLFLGLEVTGGTSSSFPTWCWRSLVVRGFVSWFSPSRCFSCRVCCCVVLVLGTCTVLKAAYRFVWRDSVSVRGVTRSVSSLARLVLTVDLWHFCTGTRRALLNAGRWVTKHSSTSSHFTEELSPARLALLGFYPEETIRAI